MYYVIESKTMAGACNYDELGNNTVVRIQDRPGLTNMGNRPLVEGWLGTTNNVHEQAHGEFADLAAAEAYVAEHWPHHVHTDDEPAHSAGEGSAMVYFDGRDYWEAGDWLQFCNSDDIGVTAHATDEEIVTLADKLAKEAETENTVIVFVESYLAELRNNIRES